MIRLSIQSFLILICRRDNFVYHHLGCTSIYRPLSYPFRSLIFKRLGVCFGWLIQGGRGHWIVNNASTQSFFEHVLFVSLKTFCISIISWLVSFKAISISKISTKNLNLLMGSILFIVNRMQVCPFFVHYLIPDVCNWSKFNFKQGNIIANILHAKKF